MIRASLLVAATTLALIALVQVVWSTATADAAERTPAFASAESTLDSPVPQQLQETTADEQRVSVQMWTLLASGGAAALGLVLFLVRMAMGWVKPPPPQEGAQH